MTFLFKYQEAHAPVWAEAFAKELPELPFKIWPDMGNPDDVRFLLFYEPVEDIGIFKNLDVLFTMSAGVEQALRLPLPPHLQLVRMVEPGLTAGMAEYVVGSVLAIHRGIPKYLARQARRLWLQDAAPRAGDRRVGIMGAGVLGLACLDALRPFGFPLSVWSRARKEIEGVRCHAGMRELREFLSATDILICLLPLTPATEAILNADMFNLLPQGASLISVGRGKQIVEADLLAALDSGHLEHAVLDVFETEPLPEESPIWTHQKIWVTPHIASDTQADTGADAVIQNIKRYLNRQPLMGLVNREHGY